MTPQPFPQLLVFAGGLGADFNFAPGLRDDPTASPTAARALPYWQAQRAPHMLWTDFGKLYGRQGDMLLQLARRPGRTIRA